MSARSERLREAPKRPRLQARVPGLQPGGVRFLDAQNRGPREPIWRNRRWQVPLRSWVGVFVLVFVLNLLFAFCGAGAQSQIPFSDFVAQVNADNVKSAEFLGNQITGQFVHPYKGHSDYLTEEPPGDSGLVQLLLNHKVQVSASESAFQWLGNTLNLLSVLFMLLLIGSIAYQARTGSRLAFGIGQSRARMYTEERPKVTFADVASNEEAKEDLQEIVDYLRSPVRYTKVGARIPHGVLLSGPPGTGKTLMARAVAGEAKVPFFSVAATEFVEMFVGVGAARIRDLFDRAKKVAPSIIFVDEIDAIGRQRSNNVSIGGNDEREQTLNQLLVEMDGFEPNQSVIVIAATNRPDVLDPALLPPGRFARQIVIANPDIVGRERILKVHVRKVPLAPDVDLRTVARGTPGFSGADLMNLVNEAALLAARRAKRFVTMSEFEDSKDKIMMGAERRTMVMTEQEKMLTAYHEGGHAIVALNVPATDPVHKATIIPRGRALGMVMQLPERDRLSMSFEQITSRLAICMGGRVSEEIIFGKDKITSGAQSDIEQATKLARAMVTRWGFSEELGTVMYGENQEEVFLGYSMGRQQNISE